MSHPRAGQGNFHVLHMLAVWLKENHSGTEQFRLVPQLPDQDAPEIWQQWDQLLTAFSVFGIDSQAVTTILRGLLNLGQVDEAPSSAHGFNRIIDTVADDWGLDQSAMRKLVLQGPMGPRSSEAKITIRKSLISFAYRGLFQVRGIDLRDRDMS